MKLDYGERPQHLGGGLCYQGASGKDLNPNCTVKMKFAVTIQLMRRHILHFIFFVYVLQFSCTKPTDIYTFQSQRLICESIICKISTLQIM